MTTLSCAYRPHTAVWTRTSHSSSARGIFSSPYAISAGIPSTSHRIAGVGRYSASTTRSRYATRVAAVHLKRSSARTPPTHTTAPPGAVLTTGTPARSETGIRASLSRSDTFLLRPLMPNGHITSPGTGPSTHRRAKRASAGISPREPASIRSQRIKEAIRRGEAPGQERYR